MIDFKSYNEIEKLCRKFLIHNYTIKNDGSVDVEGSVTIAAYSLNKIPIKFGKILGNFYCNHNNLTTLENSPQSISGDFNCSNNQLISLKEGPKSIGGSYMCSNNKLKNLIGSPEKINGDFLCTDNELISLKGGPKSKVEVFNCSNNRLTSLEGSPEKVLSIVVSFNNLTSLEGCSETNHFVDCQSNKIYTLKGGPDEVAVFGCENNPIESLYHLFHVYQGNYQYNILKRAIDDFDFIRGDKIVKHRLEQALSEIGKECPDKVKGYELI